MTKILIRIWFKDEYYYERICEGDFQYCPDNLIMKHGPIVTLIIDNLV